MDQADQAGVRGGGGSADPPDPPLATGLDSNILAAYVPPNSTDQLQPLDLSVNKPIKSKMKSAFIQWYSEGVAE